VAIKAYLDKSGQNSSPYVTLAAFVGSDMAWAEFEIGWREALKTGFLPVPYMHMVEALGLRPNTPFDRNLGWERKHVWDLVGKLLVFLGGLERGRITMHSCVIDMDAWRDLTASGCESPSAVELCNRYVSKYIVALFAAKVLERAPSEVFLIARDDLLNFTFDRNEDFFDPFRKFVNSEKEEAERTGDSPIWKLVDGVGEGEMKTTPGIQAADVLAWALNRESTVSKGEEGKHIAYLLHQIVMSTTKLYDRQTLSRKFGSKTPTI
jgi:hypothetical protein